jgi:hypothetical protein
MPTWQPKERGSANQPASIDEYNFAKSQGFTGTYQQWIDRPSQYKSTGGGTPSTATERLVEKQGTIIAAARNLPKGTDGYVNPNDYMDKASEYIAANGDIKSFLSALPPTRYLTGANAAYVTRALAGSGRSA